MNARKLCYSPHFSSIAKFFHEICGQNAISERYALNLAIFSPRETFYPQKFLPLKQRYSEKHDPISTQTLSSLEYESDCEICELLWSWKMLLTLQYIHATGPFD